MKNNNIIKNFIFFKKNFKSIAIFLCIINIFTHQAFVFAFTNVNLKKIYDCYFLFTGEIMSPQSFLLKNLNLKNLSDQTALEVCNQIQQSGLLDTNGNLAVKTDATKPIEQVKLGEKILNYFFLTMASWFERKDYVTSFSSGEVSKATYDVNDVNAHVYYYLYALFYPQAQVHDIVTLNTLISAKRDGGVARNKHLFLLNNFINNSIYDLKFLYLPNNSDLPTTFNVTPLVPAGNLIGLDWSHKNSATLPLDYFNNQNASESPLEIQKHFGAGAMGTQSYLMLNMGQGVYVKNTGLILPRTYMNSVVKDFLCRSLPSLTTNDVLNEVEPTSKLPFRKNAACMSCHVTTDNAVAVIRNYSIGRSIKGSANSSHAIAYAFTLPTTRSDTDLPTLAENKLFWATPNHGKFIWRDLNNNLISTELNSLADLGEALTQTDDFYMCLVQRLMNLFYGLKNIESNPILASYQEKIKYFATKLKETQNLNLISREMLFDALDIKKVNLKSNL